VFFISDCHNSDTAFVNAEACEEPIVFCNYFTVTVAVCLRDSVAVHVPLTFAATATL